MKIKETGFDGIYLIDGKLATVNMTPGYRVYGEELARVKSSEYRLWDLWRSKPAAAIKRGLKEFPLKKGMKILYLGIASGTTSSHFSDILGPEGLIYGVDIAERVLRELVSHAEIRGNIIPILGDARKPEEYGNIIVENVDLIYEDVASPDQVQILIRNVQKFLKSHGFVMIAIKSQSIDVTKDPKAIYKECLNELKKHFEILDKIELDPYEKDHMFIVMKSKK